MNVKCIIEITMGVIMASVIPLVFIRSLWNAGEKTVADGTKSYNRVGGIGARVIQFTCIALIVPAIIILALENVLKGETIATIIGGLIGYVLSGVSNYDKKKE